MYKRFLAFYLLFLTPFAIAVVGNYLYLLHSSEYVQIDELVQRHMQNDRFCLFDSGIGDRTFDYKLAAAKKIRPAILATGSSRSLEIRKQFFSKTFYNAANATESLSQTEAYLRELLKTHKPEIVFMGLDIWLFRDDTKYLEFLPKKWEQKNILNSVFLPFEWLLKRKIQWRDYLNTVAHNPYNECILGVAARTLGRGTAKDGSYYYTDLITGKTPSTDRNFSDFLGRIESGADKLMYAENASIKEIDRLQSITDWLQSEGVQVILYLHPFAPSIIDAMKIKGTRYAYIDDLRKELSQRRIPYYDFHDPRTIHSTDCEFIDGLHGGDVTYARVLQAIYNASPISQPYIDRGALVQYISAFAGLAMGKDERVTTLPETDFLDMGCVKR